MTSGSFSSFQSAAELPDQDDPTGYGHLWFECGATLPHSGELKSEPPLDHVRKRDGRTRLLVCDTEGGIARPILPDGTKAHCMMGCPKIRASGIKQERCFPSDESKTGKQWRFIVACYPEHREGPAPGKARRVKA